MVRVAFEKASSNEWIAFLLIEPRGAEVVATSGGMFVSDARLHLVLANHRARLVQDSEEVGRARANPFYSVNGSGGALGFESSRVVMGTQQNWSGGHRASASELILGHAGFFSYLKVAGRKPDPSRVPVSFDQTLSILSGNPSTPSQYLVKEANNG